MQISEYKSRISVFICFAVLTEGAFLFLLIGGTPTNPSCWIGGVGFSKEEWGV
jgi:hypothetical protein